MRSTETATNVAGSGGGDTEEQAGHGARERQRTDKADADAGKCQRQSFADHQPCHIDGLCAQREPHAHLACPLRHGIGQDAVRYPSPRHGRCRLAAGECARRRRVSDARQAPSDVGPHGRSLAPAGEGRRLGVGRARRCAGWRDHMLSRPVLVKRRALSRSTDCEQRKSRGPCSPSAGVATPRRALIAAPPPWVPNRGSPPRFRKVPWPATRW
jgi:hypothetical protein